MSKAGIQSNRGDGYQTLIAFDWAITVLSDPDYEWIEVDSATFPVDDVVIGKRDGSKICCQCKKNQTNFKSWSIGDLADELRKAGILIDADSHTKVRFYSRNDFGEIAALREYSINFADELSYRSHLGKAHRESDAKLQQLLAEISTNPSSYNFLRHLEFITSDNLERMQTLLFERLRLIATNTSAAYDALWTRLDELGIRLNRTNTSVAAQHRLTKNDLKSVLREAGATIAPPLTVYDAYSSIRQISAIGRDWQREIGRQRIANPLVEEIVSAIEMKPGSILLTGAPGSGKTCVMLNLQEALERKAATNSDLIPLFIQSREFADTATMLERKAHGLSEFWVEEAARAADNAHVVVVIDSLDVLSISREHSVLKYFLIQIDRLLSIPNITVVTACRDFDRHYDSRIARRNWGREFRCEPLNWDLTVAPLLTKLNIETAPIDPATRELIRNPRELALFVDLAERDGPYMAVSSQALATYYLSKIVQADTSLGNSAIETLESIATSMIKYRSLKIPAQRFGGSQETLRALLSHNILHQANDGTLSFGHQTLLDVLVVNGAIRLGKTLGAFIEDLPPVPFIRPSIRSFIAQLMTGDRKELRKQLRTVLCRENSFHIKRLVAETFAEQPPQEDDWNLIRDLRKQHPEVFQLVYLRGFHPEWNLFWLKHLVPELMRQRDADGLIRHVNRIEQWKNDNTIEVLQFWTETFNLPWINKRQIAAQLEIHLCNIDKIHSSVIAPLVKTLLRLRQPEHNYLGGPLAACVEAGVIDDLTLWNYIADNANDSDDERYYNFGKNIRCQPHDFGRNNEDFLSYRMQSSTVLLNLAIGFIEKWSRAAEARYSQRENLYWDGFLNRTSHSDAHSTNDRRHTEDGSALLDAVEQAVMQHAKDNSEWWQANRTRLCFNGDGGLRYFGILACALCPEKNIDTIGEILTNKEILESDLSYELGTLAHVSFLHLSTAVQDKVQATFLSIYSEIELRFKQWALKQRAQFISCIPCHFRFELATSLIIDCEKETWPYVRAPEISNGGGFVGSPFTFEVFLSLSDSVIVELLRHYDGYRSDRLDEILNGGEREVGRELEQASSRNPTRFLQILKTQWDGIPRQYCNDIIDGVANYLAYRYGNLQWNGEWSAVEDPEPSILASQVLDELVRHHNHWALNRAASKALQGCAYVTTNPQDAERLVFLGQDFLATEDTEYGSGDNVDLLTAGINMTRGHIADALMILATQLEKRKLSWPKLLYSSLRTFASDNHPAIRVVLLRRLPILQSHQEKLGWDLFNIALQNHVDRIIPKAEPCLYYSYHKNFDAVAPWLDYIYSRGAGKDLESWGRISALAALSDKIAFSDFCEKLVAKNNPDAWLGAADVWAVANNTQHNYNQCMAGLELGMHVKNQHASLVARKFRKFFHSIDPLVSIPQPLIERFFDLMEKEQEPSAKDVFGYNAWLNELANYDSLAALDAAEVYLKFVRRTKPFMHDYEQNFAQLLTTLFAQAEEREEIDNGTMLERVVNVQDELLSLGVKEIDAWLTSAERA